MAESTLARRLRVKLQLRDKKGRWIEMGGGGKWLSGDGVMKSGIVIGSKGNTAILREKNADGTLGTKDIHVNMKQLEMIESKASLDPNTLKLVNSFKNNQSAKGIKEADARAQALTQAKADLQNGKAAVDEAEVEYEATVAEELEDLLLDAPAGTKLEGPDFLSTKKKGKLAITKAADGSWTAGGYSNTFTAKEIATDGNFEDFRSTAADGKAINDLFTEASKSNKKGIFKKKSAAPKNPYIGVPVNNLDDIINVTNAMLGLPNNSQPQAAPAPQPAKVDAPQAPAAKAPEAPAAPQAVTPAPAAPNLDSIINSTNAMLGKAHDNQAKAAGPAPVQKAPEAEAPQAPEAPEAPEASDALIDISDWKYHQGTQGGSNPGGIYTAPDGKDYYVKKSKSDLHAKNEVLADKFYEKLGVKTSQLKLADVGGGKLGTASEMVPGSKNDFLSKSQNDPEYLKKFQEDFAIDAWLANWDVVGLEYDNALTDANGDPTRIDPGGALLYRAMGSPKGDMFGVEVGEWDSMRHGSNPASKTFGSMTNEQLKNSAAKLLNISEYDINDIVDSMDFDEDTSDYLKETLTSRRLNILAKFPDLGTKPKPAVADAPAAPDAIKLTGKPAVQTPASQPSYVDPKAFAPKTDAEFATLVADTKAKAMAGEVIDVTPFIKEMHALEPDEAPSLAWDNPSQADIAAFKDHFDGYNSDDKAALSNYVNNSDEMNWMARGSDLGHNYIKNDSNWASKIAADIAKMDNLIAKSVVQEDTKVFRGVAMNSERLQKFLDSKMYSDLGFSSTSNSEKLANDWGFVDGNWQKNKTQVTLNMDLPAGFTAHRVLYSDEAGTNGFHQEEEVILPRGTDFDVTGIEEYTNTSGQKAYRLNVTPILNDKNYKPEGIKNGQSSEDTTAGELPGAVEDTGDSTGTPENGDGGGQYADPNTGGSTGEEGSEPEAQGVEESEVAPEAPEEAETVEESSPADEAPATDIPEEGNAGTLTPEQFKDLPEGTVLTKKAYLTDAQSMPFTKIGPDAWQRSDQAPSGYGDKGITRKDSYLNGLGLSGFVYSLPSSEDTWTKEDEAAHQAKWAAVAAEKKEAAAAKKAAEDAAKAEQKAKHEAWKEAQKNSPKWNPPRANTLSPEEFKDLPVGTRLEHNSKWGDKENTYKKTGPNTWKSQDGTLTDGWGNPVMETDDDSIFLDEDGEHSGSLNEWEVNLPGSWDKHIADVKKWNEDQKKAKEAPADETPVAEAPEAPAEVDPSTDEPEAPEEAETVEEAPEEVPEAPAEVDPSTDEPEAPEEAETVEEAPEEVPEAPAEVDPSTDESSEDEAPVEAPETVEEDTSAVDGEEDIAPINGAKTMLWQMAKKQGISLTQLQDNLGLPADGAFPNKGKTVSNENGDVFEANAIVSNPKFGEGIASIILPSTNSVKVLYKDHGYKVTQAKNLGLVNGAAPDEVAAEAVDLSAAKPGDVGTNPANGKMYFVGKNNKVLYIGDEVDYTKKGVTQSGKISSIYKGAKTVKVDFEDGSSGVKKASQLVGKDKSSDNSSEGSAPETEAPAQAETVDAAEETTAPEAVESVPEATETPEAPAAPEAPEEAPEAAGIPATGENKGWTPAEGYDPMGPTTVQVMPDLKSATVYAHDNSGNAKEEYKLKGAVKYNPIEKQYFGVGHNGQPLYAGDAVDYLWLGQQYKGKIVKVHPTTNSATVELEDGTMKMKKFSQLRGNYPKKVDVDENGNYTDWHGKPAQIPNFNNGGDNTDTTPEAPEAVEETAPEAPEAPEAVEETPEAPEAVPETVPESSVADFEIGTVVPISDTTSISKTGDGEWKMSVNGIEIDQPLTDEFAQAVHDKLNPEVSKPTTPEAPEDVTPEAEVAEEVIPEVAEEVIPEIPEVAPVAKPTQSDLWNAPKGQSLIIDGETFTKVGLGGHWFSPSSPGANSLYLLTPKVDAAESVEFGEIGTSNVTKDRIEALGKGATLESAKLGLTATKDGDGDWIVPGTSYSTNDEFPENFPVDDWEITNKGEAPKPAPTHTAEELVFMNGGTKLTLGEKVFIKTSKNDGEDWIEPKWGNLWTNDEIIETMSESDDSPRFDTAEVESNLTLKQLEDLKNGAEIYSEKLQATLTKDSDNDWSSSEYSSGYLKDNQLLEMFNTDDWEINSTGHVESNYSEYDLDAAPAYSQLYSVAHDKTFNKMEDGDWEDLQSGYTMGSSELLTEYADEDFTLSKSEIDESYTYGKDSSEFADLAPGSKINYTSDPTEEPTEYIKLDEDKWATLNYDGQPDLSATPFGDDDFEDGYSHVHHEAEEGDYTPPKLLEFESNAPDMGKDDITAEWVNSLPVGTMLKTSMSNKWSYEKTEEGWKTLNEYGQPKQLTPATDDALFNAASGKTDLTNIFIPETSEDVTPEAPAAAETAPLKSFTEDSFKALPIGSTLTTGGNSIYTKEAENHWTAVNGAKFKDDEFTSLMEYATAGEWKVYSPEGIPSVDTPETPEAAAPSETGVEGVKKLKDTSFDEFLNAPVGSQIISNGDNGYIDGTAFYTKKADGNWETQAGHPYAADNFKEFIKDESDLYSFKTPDAADSETTKSMEDVSFADFQNVPVGSTINHNSEAGASSGNLIYTKTGINTWENIGGALYTSDDFKNLLESSSGKNFDLKTPESVPETPVPETPSEEPVNATGTKPLSDYTYAEFKELEIGTVVTQTENGDVYKKVNSTEWEVDALDDLLVESDAFDYLFNANSEIDKYVVTPVAWAPEKTLNDVDYTDLMQAPVGSTIKNKSGMTITKNAEGKWYSDGGMFFKTTDFVNYANTGKGKDFAVDLGGTPTVASPSSASPVQKGIHISKEVLDGYPVGTTIKQEMPSYVSVPSHSYYVKLDSGNWQMFKKTNKTLSAKNVMGANALGSHYGTYTVSKPTSDVNFVTALGEIGYVGDTVTGDLGKGHVTKVMKTGVKVQWQNGEKTTVKPSKVTMGDSSFGFKQNQQAPQQAPQPTSTTSGPVPSVDAAPSQDFAGFDPEDFNAKGLTMGHSENHIITTAYTLAPSHAADTSNPLYGKPEPKAPETPETYPSFVAPSNDLPKWDSEEWLKKVEKRYADNPKKAKDTVQESNNWTAIQQVMNGEKIHLDKLLSSMYLDQDMYDEAIAGIDKQEDSNKALIEQHEKDVVAAKVKYDADKAAYLADYTAKKAAYEKEFADWSYANPNPDAMKPVYKPAGSKENFMGGDVDWSKAHIGTHTAETVMDSIRVDNAVARTGLSIATDSDKIENLNVKVNRIVSAQGDEVFDMRFKTTADHGKTLRKFFKMHDSKVGNTVYPPHMIIDPKNSGLIKDMGTANKTSQGERFEMTHDATGAKIIFQQDPNEKEFNMNTNHNSVRILMPLSSTPAEYQQVLEFLGISGKPASEGDIRVYAENRLITLFGEGKAAISHKNFSGEERQKILDKIKSQWDITADDVEFVPEPNGKLRLHYKPEVTERLAKQFDNIKTMYHSIYSGSASVDAWMNILTGPNAGLASTYFRWGNAIGYNGQSSGQDLENGAGDYVYVTPQAHLSVGGNAIGIHPKAIIQRLDLWANYNDSWGKKNEDGKNYGAMEKISKFGTSLAEIMPGESIHLNDMMYVSVADHYRKDILEQLKAKGILQINGIPIEDFVLASGMQPPVTDYIPGVGVVPAGATGIEGSVATAAGGGPAV